MTSAEGKKETGFRGKIPIFCLQNERAKSGWEVSIMLWFEGRIKLCMEQL